MEDVLNLLVYAAYSKNEEIRLNSSSGGVFSLLSEYVLSLNGIVYGVAMSNDCKNAEFVRVDDIKELFKLRGSKYLQARLGNSFKNVRDDLKKGLTVLFTGTPCQINGLKRYLGNEYNNLYCIDVICHGTPSPALWKKYVEYIETKSGAKLVEVNFRCKDDSWANFGIKEIDSNHNQVYISKDVDPYMQMFLQDYCLRPSCYVCEAKKNKMSDMTIADFWGIENVAPEMDDGQGVSLILIRNAKGKKIFEEIKKDLHLKRVDYESSVKSNLAEYSSVKRPNERDTFFEDMHKMSFDELAKKYASPKKKPLKCVVKEHVKKLMMKTPLRKLMNGNCKKSY